MILVTGTAGFIGFHLARKLLEQGHDVIGYDNVNHYYDPSLKEARLKILSDWEQFKFYKKDLTDEQAISAVFANDSPTISANNGVSDVVSRSKEMRFALLSFSTNKSNPL